jgi:hypothetical protein
MSYTFYLENNSKEIYLPGGPFGPTGPGGPFGPRNPGLPFSPLNNKKEKAVLFHLEQWISYFRLIINSKAQY